MAETLKATAYVSLSRITPADAAEAIRSLVEHARLRNFAESVAGGLLYTGKRFAQYLEGPPASEDAIMDDIRRDDRHEQVCTFHDAAVEERRCEDWSLAYNGISTYVDKHLAQLAEAQPGTAEFDVRSRAVFTLIHRFARD